MQKTVKDIRYWKRLNLSVDYNYKHMHNNKRIPKYMKQTLTELKREISSTVIVGDFNGTLS